MLNIKTKETKYKKQIHHWFQHSCYYKIKNEITKRRNRTQNPKTKNRRMTWNMFIIISFSIRVHDNEHCSQTSRWYQLTKASLTYRKHEKQGTEYIITVFLVVRALGVSQLLFEDAMWKTWKDLASTRLQTSPTQSKAKWTCPQNNSHGHQWMREMMQGHAKNMETVARERALARWTTSGFCLGRLSLMENALVV